ncbi:S8 family serine peptidase [Solirubrobacter ginsenosidimutans]|nr:S8 family serine peptidase [Solirubrobacter ginsenosidimutans]
MAPVAMAGETARGVNAGGASAASAGAAAGGTGAAAGGTGAAANGVAGGAGAAAGGTGAAEASGGGAGASSTAAALAGISGGVVLPSEATRERYRARQVVVRYGGAHASSAGAVPKTRVLRVPRGLTVAQYAQKLRTRPGVLSATANYVAHISGWVPPDPGSAGIPAGWSQLQWNFMPETGVDAPDAWQHLLDVGRPGGAGVTVAVVDTGIAYANRGRFKRSPDFSQYRFVRGWDFVGGDPYPNDDNGHGTHVAGTIAEGTGNNIALTGLAFGAKLMPVKVLDRDGEGDSARIAQGIRYAADHGAKIINLSFEFPTDITRSQIPNILDAIRHAKAKGVLVVGASGNAAAAAVAYPARSGDVLSVGATTQHGCQADYSNEGTDLDIVAPGGGVDNALDDDPNCRPSEPAGMDIFQMTFTHTNGYRRFGLPTGFIGTSMAAPHVAATAALVVASGILGPDPTPDAIERRLEQTARDLGPPGKDPHYGAGLLNAAAATDPAIPVT